MIEETEKPPSLDELFERLAHEINYVIDVPGMDEVGNALLTVQAILLTLKNHVHSPHYGDPLFRRP